MGPMRLDKPSRMLAHCVCDAVAIVTGRDGSTMDDLSVIKHRACRRAYLYDEPEIFVAGVEQALRELADQLETEGSVTDVTDPERPAEPIGA